MLSPEIISILPNEILQKILKNKTLSNANVIDFSLSSKRVLKTVVINMLQEFIELCDKSQEYIVSSMYIGGNQMDYVVYYQFIVDHGKIKVPVNLKKYPTNAFLYPETENETTEYKKTNVSGLYEYLRENVPTYGSFQSLTITPGDYGEPNYIVLSKAVSLVSMLNKIEKEAEYHTTYHATFNGGRRTKQQEKPSTSKTKKKN